MTHSLYIPPPESFKSCDDETVTDPLNKEIPVITPAQEPASAIPGNIGTVKAKVMVWDHDPMYARPHQNSSYHFGAPLDTRTTTGGFDELLFEAGGVCLKPQLIPYDMFIATIRKKNNVEFINPSVGPDGNVQINKRIDLVGSQQSGVPPVASDALPGGVDYETPDTTFFRFGKDIFPHQLWIHVGNLFDRGVTLHPSEYGKNLSEIESLSALAGSPGLHQTLLEKIAASPKFHYQRKTDGAGVAYFTSAQNNKAIDNFPIHWTIEKFTPVWQGEDFFIRFFIEKETDDTVDNESGKIEDLDADWIDSDWFDYNYLLFEPRNPPIDYDSVELGWIDGISNEAFWIPPQQDDQISTQGAAEVARKESRKQYWWKYKTYVLIEIGVEHRDHHYFIEIVKGRNPRFLHLGLEWDHPDRLTKQDLDPNKFGFIRKCRVLSEYKAISSDVLLKKGSTLGFIVRNHLGRIIVTFEGYESQPWVISRRDNDPNAELLQFRIQRLTVPMVVPAAPIRIHAGSLASAFNFSPITYTTSAQLTFRDRQLDSHDATHDDVYASFAYTGGSQIYRSKRIKEDFFSDDRFLGSIIGYDCDAFATEEFLAGPARVRLYDYFNLQYRTYGKGWLLDKERTVIGDVQRVTIPGPEGEQIDTRILKPHKLKNGMDDDIEISGLKGIPSVARIYDAGEGRFSLSGLSFRDAPNYPYRDFLVVWDIGITLKSGTVLLPPHTGFDPLEGKQITLDKRSKARLFHNVITPIVNNWQIIMLGGGKPFGKTFGADTTAAVSGASETDRAKATPFDIAPLVTKITDGWTADGYTTMNHEAKISCYIPVGVPIITGTEEIDLGMSFGQGGQTRSGDIPFSFVMPPDAPGDNENTFGENLYALGQKLQSLHNKTFYVTISYWWESGVGIRSSIGGNENRDDSPLFGLDDLPEAFQTPQEKHELVQMTGVAYGAELEKSANRIYMHFTVKDYMSIFKNQYIFNSPFFDAVTDTVAIYELAKMAGFDDSTQPQKGIDRRPLGFLQYAITKGNRHGDGRFVYNGERVRCVRFDLPGSYASIAEPAVRFKNGQTYEDCIKQIAQYYGTKAVYFDRWGILRFENLPAVEAAFRAGDTRNDEFEPAFNFYSTPFEMQNLRTEGGAETVKIPDFDPNKHAAHLVYEVIRFSRSVEDCVNQLVILTASTDVLLSDGRRTGGLIVEGYTFFEQIWNPEVEGFIGFRKPFYQSNGVFGGLEGVRKTMEHYAKMKYPPATISFETYGVPGLKALDIITLDGNLFYITEIAHDLDPSTNKWWMRINAEWLKSFTGTLGILDEKSPESGTPSDKGTLTL